MTTCLHWRDPLARNDGIENCRHPPPGPAFGRSDDRLRRVTQ
jgi:hypothetical protein